MVDSGPRNPLDDLWLAVLLLAAPFVAWWAWSDHFVSWAFQLKLAELRLLHTLGLGSADTLELTGALQGALTAPERIDFATFQFGLDAAGACLRGPVAAALAVLGVWLLAGHPAGRFRRRFDLQRLAEAMREAWPFALHALRRGHLALPLDHAVWGMAASGAVFLKRHDLVERTAVGWTLREARAEQVLAAQLGAPWAVGSPPPHVRALAGLFALRIAGFEAPSDAEAERLKNRAFELLRQLARSAAAHKAGGYLPTAAVYTRVIAKTAPFLNAGTVQALVAHHVYTQTVLLRLLAEARRCGALPPALFSWLKGVDRPLWYALSSLGRRVPFVETLGAVAHYQAELAAGRALYPPAVEAAVEGLWLEVRRLPPPPAAPV